MLIDNTYFYSGITKIAGIGKEPIDSTVTAFIQQYEPEFLIKLLGYTLYDLMITNPTEQRFLDLVNGGTYVYRGRTEQYKGLKYSYGTGDAEVKYSMIANYVYYQYLAVGAVQIGTTGTSVTTTENADRIPPIYKQTPAWNAMVDQVRSLRGYIHANTAIYPEFTESYCDRDLYRYVNNMNI